MTTFQRPSDSQTLSVCILAGEASGDAQGALLAQSLASEFARAGIHIQLWGSAGELMKRAGVEPVVHIDELSAMGFAEVVAVYPRLSAAAHRLQSEMSRRRPDLTILIDYPGLNMRLMEDAYHLGSCVIYHIPPKVWAHGVGRVARLRDCTYLVTCILPFEEKLLRQAGVNAHFIGNPLNDAIYDFYKQNGELPASLAAQPVVGLVPGSRTGEVERVFPDMIRAYVKTRRALGAPLRAVVPVAPTLSTAHVESILNDILRSEAAHDFRGDIELLSRQPLIKALQGCSYAWVCSGTAALETSLLGIPHSVVYRMHWLTYAIAKKIVRIPFVSLENLCGGREIVPEFIQDQVNPNALSEHALSVLSSAEQAQKMRRELLSLKEVFPRHSALNAARMMVECYLNLPEDSSRRFHWKATRDVWFEEKQWGLNQ